MDAMNRSEGRRLSTFSPTSRLPADERERLLDAIALVAEHAFGVVVERPLLTALYTARRPVR